MARSFEQELISLPLNKLLQLTEILTKIYPEQAAKARISSQQQSDERQERIANRLIESVLPIFISDERERPQRLGTCVLARIDSNYFAFTAGHVLDQKETSVLSVAVCGKLIPIPCSKGFKSIEDCSGTDLDIGVMPLSTSNLGTLAQKTFLSPVDLDETGEPDKCTLSSFHFVIGFPASRKLFKINHSEGKIHQSSFQIQTSPPDPGTYEQEGILMDDHVLVEFDQERMIHRGQMHTAPDPKGISGGGIFYIDKKTELGPLIAIATEHRSKSRLMVGTRIKHFLNVARQLNFERSDLFE